jgi:hypothetical protein
MNVSKPIIATYQFFVRLYSRTEVRILLWLVLIVSLILACFTDLYVIVKDAIDWFRK